MHCSQSTIPAHSSCSIIKKLRQKCQKSILMFTDWRSVTIWESFHPTPDILALLLNWGHQIFGVRGQKRKNGKFYRNVDFNFFPIDKKYVNMHYSPYAIAFHLMFNDLAYNWRSHMPKRPNFKKCCKLFETCGELIFSWNFNCKPLFYSVFCF